MRLSSLTPRLDCSRDLLHTCSVLRCDRWNLSSTNRRTIELFPTQPAGSQCSAVWSKYQISCLTLAQQDHFEIGLHPQTMFMVLLRNSCLAVVSTRHSNSERKSNHIPYLLPLPYSVSFNSAKLTRPVTGRSLRIITIVFR